MEPGDEEARNGRQEPNGPSTEKDESAPNVDTTTPTDKGQTPENGNDGGDQSEIRGFAPFLYSTDREQNDLLEKDETTISGRAHICSTMVELLKTRTSDRIQNADQTQDSSGTHINRDQDVPPVRRPQSPRSLENSRVEKVSQDNSDHGSDSDASSGSSTDTGSENGRGISREKADHVSKSSESVVSRMRPEDVDDDSPSRLEWLRQKREDNEQNPFLDRLMLMVGLEQVKAHFLAVKARVKASKSDDAEPTKLRLHLVLQGKDGTGKF
jgi:hypothetical protein